MSETLPVVYLARHCETAWSVARRHTGRTDLPLTPAGEAHARRLGPMLQRLPVAAVYTSPLTRARRTCELAGFGDRAELDADLVEWDYGEYEGLRGSEIQARRPGWELFRDGAPGGESPADVTARVDRVIARLRAADRSVLLFSSSHALRALVARWLGQDIGLGRAFVLATGGLSALGYDHTREEPAVRLWNAIYPE